MDKVLQIAKDIKKELNNLDEFKEYFKYKKLYEETEYLIKLRAKIAKSNKANRDKLLEQYNTDPIVVNYLYYREEVNNILRTVRNLID